MVLYNEKPSTCSQQESILWLGNNNINATKSHNYDGYFKCGTFALFKALNVLIFSSLAFHLGAGLVLQCWRRALICPRRERLRLILCVQRSENITNCQAEPVKKPRFEERRSLKRLRLQNFLILSRPLRQILNSVLKALSSYRSDCIAGIIDKNRLHDVDLAMNCGPRCINTSWHVVCAKSFTVGWFERSSCDNSPECAGSNLRAMTNYNSQ